MERTCSDENSSLRNWILARNFLKKSFWPLCLGVDCSQSQGSIKPLCRVCSQKLNFSWPTVAFFELSEYSSIRFIAWFTTTIILTFESIYCKNQTFQEGCPKNHAKNYSWAGYQKFLRFPISENAQRSSGPKLYTGLVYHIFLILKQTAWYWRKNPNALSTKICWTSVQYTLQSTNAPDSVNFVWRYT
jgi:hypothetical protein